MRIVVGQHSDKGRKAASQDFHGICIPKEPQLSSKGIALALADGISSSEVSQLASETAVTGFLADYFCTSEAWSVKQSVQRVLYAINSWLHAQTGKANTATTKTKATSAPSAPWSSSPPRRTCSMWATPASTDYAATRSSN
jgi:serine/threonine protein phosphatase PrpC